MSDYMVNRAFAIGLIISFFAVGIIPSLNGNIFKNNENFCISSYSDSSSILDWWPMNKHDVYNTGYSSSMTPPLTNTIRWTFQTNQFVYYTPTIVDGKVYIGSSDEYLYCLDADTGSLIWEYHNYSMLQTTTSACVMDGKVYFGTSYGVLCLDAITGEELWDFYTGYAIWMGLVVVDGKVYTTSYYGKIRIYCLDVDTGEVIWDYINYEGGVVSAPAVYNGKIYVGNVSEIYYGFLNCFDADTGDILWNFTTGGFAYSTPSIFDGRVYFSGNGLHCLDAETGDELWTFLSPDGNTSYGPSVAYGRIYYLGRYGTIFCLDAVSGDELWNNTVGIDVELGPQFVAVADGKIYVCICSSGKLLCMDAFTGELIWDYELCPPGDGFVSPAIVDNRLYISSGHKGIVYCFEDNSGPPSAPTIDGPSSGKPRNEYYYTFDSFEPDDDGVYYLIDWGDGEIIDWIGPFSSGEVITTSHFWVDRGTYIIKAKARDIFGSESDWSEFEVTIPRTRASSYHWLLERFPLLERLLSLLC